MIDTEHEGIEDLVIVNSFAADGGGDNNQQDLQNLQCASMPALAGITATCILIAISNPLSAEPTWGWVSCLHHE